MKISLETLISLKTEKQTLIWNSLDEYRTSASSYAAPLVQHCNHGRNTPGARAPLQLCALHQAAPGPARAGGETHGSSGPCLL